MPYTRTRGYNVDESFFDAPFTEEAAYVLGFLAGDGCVHGGKIYVHLAERDKEHLEVIRKAMKSQCQIRRNGGEYPSYVMVIGSKRLVAALKRLGVGPRKSLTYDPSGALRRLPASHHRHFFRGLFDADGCVSSRYKRISLTGTEKACLEFREFLKENGVITNAKIRKLVNTQAYRYTASGALIAAQSCKILYDDSRISLTRKKEAAAVLIKRAAGRLEGKAKV